MIRMFHLKAFRDFITEHNFKGYFRTSARTGDGILQLKNEILQSIHWDDLPSVSSTKLFREIQELTLQLQEEHLTVLTIEDAYHRLLRLNPEQTPTLEEFRTCVALLKSRGLVRRLSFNDSILFNPEFLDAYASAIVNQARVDPNGLGSIKEDDVLKRRFLMNQAERVPDSEVEQVLIIATLEDIITRQLAFREVTSDDAIIVFPSQFTRENPDLPAPDGIELRIRFNGPLQNIYSIMTVRLFYTKTFNLTEIWKNGVVVRDDKHRRAGFQISDFADGQGEIALFFEQGISNTFKKEFSEFVHQHVFGMAASGSIRATSVIRCRSCGTEFTNAQIEGRRARRFENIQCSVCSEVNPLSSDTVGKIVGATSYATSAAIMQAQETAEREANASVASAMLQRPDIREWLQRTGTEAHVVVFTDMVASTQTNSDIGDIAMDEIKKCTLRCCGGTLMHAKVAS